MDKTKYYVKRAIRLMVQLLKDGGKYNLYRYLKRRYKHELKAKIYISTDTCPDEYPQRTLYQAEVFQEDNEDGLIYVTIATTLDEVMDNLKEYLDE